MKLKKAVQIIEYSNQALIIGLFIGVFALVSKSGDGKFFVFEILFAIPFIMTFIFRKVIINFYLRKSAYPGVFYSVLDKLGLTRNLDIPLTDELLNEIYKPSYSTNQFIVDNNLKTEIGAKKIQLPVVFLCIGLGIAGLFYFGEKFSFQEKPLIFIMIILFVAMNIYSWTKGKKQQNDNEAIAFFKDTELELPSLKLNWKDIYDWSCQAGGKNESDKIIINFYDQDNNIQEATQSLSEINIDKIDFLLLMTHFKAKYG
jgi:cbb3-type cytochrome oxidase subunit 3